MLELENLVIGHGSTSLLKIEGRLLLGPGLHQLSGANGVGKSTLLKTLAGLEPALAGTITLQAAGQEARQLKDQDPSWKAQVRYVPEHGGYWSDLSARENLELAGFCHGLAKSDAASRASVLLDWWAIEDRPTRGESLSSGQQKRLSLAFALMADAAVLLLDEPFTTLDVDGLELFGQFLSLAARGSEGRLVLIAAHGWPRNLELPLGHFTIIEGSLGPMDHGVVQGETLSREALPWIL